MTAVTGAAAEDLHAPGHDSAAMTAQLVYESRFGGAAGAPMSSAFKLKFANEGQRLSGYAPLQAEFRPASGEFYVNGLNVERVLVARQGEDAGAGGWVAGFLPLALVVGAAAVIIVDGYDQFSSDGTGGSGG